MSEMLPLIPRAVLFGNPERAAVQLSPDGARLAWLAPLDGVLNIWVAPRDEPGAARAVTRDTGRGIRFYLWAYTNRHLLYLQDLNGDENWRLYCVDLDGGQARDLTPFGGTQAQIKQVSPRHPGALVIGLNNRQAEWHDLYRADLANGALTLLEQNDQFGDFVVDDELQPRLALRATPEGGQELFTRGAAGGWEPWSLIPAADALTTQPLGLDAAGSFLYMKDSRARNTSAVVAHDLHTRAMALLAEDPRADAQDVLIHPTHRHVQAVSFNYERQRWQVLDPAIAGDLAYLATLADGEVAITSRTVDDRWWVAAYVVDNGPVRYYLYDRAAGAARFLFSNRPALEGLPLVRMHSAVIQSRDGLELVAYYSLPAGSDPAGAGLPAQPLPMVLLPHGGPWGRDVWGYRADHQWLANRGYAVLSVNFRSSTGLGKAFTNAGDKEWGGKILEDQLDAVAWAVARGLADPARVGIMGGSFGGYSTLAGLTFYPETYACGVDLVGPVNLITLLETIPPYWKPLLEMLTTRVGDHRTADGRALLTKHSPLTHVDRIRRPLLIGQGANDPRVKQAESEQIVAAMQARGIPVTYVLYPDEGHGFARPENNQSFNAIAEAFLARCLGGRSEPIGDSFAGSSLVVRTGAGEVPGLEEAGGKGKGRK